MNTVEILNPEISLATQVKDQYDRSNYAFIVVEILAAPGIEDIQVAYERLHEFKSEVELSADDLGLDHIVEYRTTDRGGCVRCTLTGRKDLMAEFVDMMRHYRPETRLSKVHTRGHHAA